MASYKARPTVYRGTPMRSRLEARYARYLDLTGADWVYEPRAYASAEGDYLPDFQIIDRGHSVFVELKPPMDTEDMTSAVRLERAMVRMEIIWASDPTASLMVVTGDHAMVADAGHWQLVDYPWTRHG